MLVTDLNSISRALAYEADAQHHCVQEYLCMQFSLV